jgi:DNA-binding CsgD family transcriptional regulator
MERAGNAGALAMGVLFGAASWSGAARGSSALLKAVAIAPLVIASLGLSAAVAASAWRLLARQKSEPRARDAARLTRDGFALTAAMAYAAFLAFELLPQFLPSSRHDSPPSYYSLAAFFAIINAGVIVSIVSRAGKDRPAAHSPDDAAMSDAGLSTREREVAALLAQGASYRDVADRLYVSVSTIQTHVTRIYAKLGVSNKVELSNALRRDRDVV